MDLNYHTYSPPHLFTAAIGDRQLGAIGHNFFRQFLGSLRVIDQELPGLFLALPQIDFAILEPGAAALDHLGEDA